MGAGREGGACGAAKTPPVAIKGRRPTTAAGVGDAVHFIGRAGEGGGEDASGCNNGSAEAAEAAGKAAAKAAGAALPAKAAASAAAAP